jgi:hypothetical protein
MDPNETLKRMLYLAAVLQDQGDPDPEIGAELATLVQAMNDWLSRGGFLPAAWAMGRDR